MNVFYIYVGRRCAWNIFAAALFRLRKHLKATQIFSLYSWYGQDIAEYLGLCVCVCVVFLYLYLIYEYIKYMRYICYYNIYKYTCTHARALKVGIKFLYVFLFSAVKHTRCWRIWWDGWWWWWWVVVGALHCTYMWVISKPTAYLPASEFCLFRAHTTKYISSWRAIFFFSCGKTYRKPRRAHIGKELRTYT